VTSSIVLIRDRRPVQLSVTAVLRELTENLREQIRAELEWEQKQLLERKHWLTLEALFVEHKIYRRIETAETDRAVRKEVKDGMQVYADQLVRPLVDDDITNLLALRIRRISAFDKAKNRGEIEEIDTKLVEVAAKLEHLTRTVIETVEGFIERYGKDFPRRTTTQSFDAIDKKVVSQQTIKLNYDRKTGFFGSSVKADKPTLSVSEYDLILGIASDGSYRIMTPPEKILFTGRLIHCATFDPDRGAQFTVVYRDSAKVLYGKRILIDKFIRNREYQLIKDKAGKIDLLLAPDETGVVAFEFAPAPRQRVKAGKFDLSKLETTGTTARGVRLAPKPVKSIKFTKRGAAKTKARSKASKSDHTHKATQSSLF
jgi:topoisomerase-4 subunit A